MDRGEPTLAPEWYRSSTGSGTTSKSSIFHNNSSLHSDDHGIKRSVRNRLTVSDIDRDVPRSSSSADRSSSTFHRSASGNGIQSHDRECSSGSRSYSSFGRNSRNRVRENDNDLRDKSRSHLMENGFSSNNNSYIVSGTGRDVSKRSHSMATERPIATRPGTDQKNGLISGASIVNSFGRTSFERDFPFLGDEERHSEVVRVSSPGLSSAIDNLTRVTLTSIGGDGWTSALAEIPVAVGGNETTTSSATQHCSADAASTTLGGSTGLNMAEALTQTPRVCPVPQTSVDSKKIEELTLAHYSKLIPMTSSMPKSLATNSLDKSKAKGARSGDNIVMPKVGHNSSSQGVNHTRVLGKSETKRTSPGGNFQVLNRDRNGMTPAKDVSSLVNTSRSMVPLGGVAPAPPPKSPTSQNAKNDIKGGGLMFTNGERKPNSQVQKRNEFFNVIRRRASPNHASNISDIKCLVESDCGATANNDDIAETLKNSVQHTNDEASCFEPSAVRSIAPDGNGSSPDEFSRAITADPVAQVPSFNNVDESYDALSSDPVDAPSAEEEAFLRELGWDESAGGDELTPEEIEDFVRQHPEKKTCLKLASKRV